LPAPIWVADLRISRRTATKIAVRHGVHATEIRDAVQCVAGLPFVWDDHIERGRRVIVRVRIRDRWFLVVLYPATHPLGDVWNLGSAYPDR
jgi:hypothetical protein